MTNRIEQGKHILKMIEAVGVNDTDTLREIEARFWWFIFNNDYFDVPKESTVLRACKLPDGLILKMPCGETTRRYPSHPRYLHDLQAIHDAMPDDVEFVLQKFNCSDCMAFDCKFTAIDFDFYTPELPTIHLAWLHAIIQAYIYMEGNDE